MSVKCRGFRRIGAPFWMSFLAMFFVHGSFSYWTCPTWIPDPNFGIYTDKIHRVCIHAIWRCTLEAIAVLWHVADYLTELLLVGALELLVIVIVLCLDPADVGHGLHTHNCICSPDGHVTTQKAGLLHTQGVIHIQRQMWLSQTDVAWVCRLNMAVTQRPMTQRVASTQWHLRTSSPNTTSEYCHLQLWLGRSNVVAIPGVVKLHIVCIRCWFRLCILICISASSSSAWQQKQHLQLCCPSSVQYTSQVSLLHCHAAHLQVFLNS